MRIVRRRVWTGVVQFDLAEVRPDVQRPRYELRSVIDLDSLRQPADCLDFFKFITGLITLDRFVHIDV